MVLVAYGLQRWPTDQYAITPGDAKPVAPLIKVEGIATNPHHDTIDLTDVYVQSLSAWQWLTAHLQSHVQFVSGDQLVEPGIPQSELGAQGYLEMSDAKQAAEVVAFRTLGWTVAGTRTGAVVTGVEASSPASRAHVHVGDLVVGVNTTVIDSGCQLINYVHGLAPGTALTLHLQRVSISSKGDLTYHARTIVAVTTSAVPSGVSTGACSGAAGPNRSWLGVSLEDGYRYTLPAKVTIDTANIGGPSAGLAMTLALINDLSGGSLTGHQHVAATGTMSVDGVVGPVGGVEEKAVAVHRAGAKYFLVPVGQGNVAAARAAKQTGLTILPVTTLTQALRDLHRLGGVKPVPLTKPS